jgi:dihydroorotate dehydrogenase
MMAGAMAVAVGKASSYESQTPLQVIVGICAFMRRRRIQNASDIVGSFQLGT